ncbi:MAG: AAA family ATPase [Clostridium sp.]|nr:AAA family ATPase [Clostridium sp.]
MIRINRVKIENFQSHVNTELTFDKGLNVIVGPSDQGKSAVVRAIKWALYNEPRGTDFIRQGTKSAKVALELSNGYTITRERSPGKNRYVLEDPEGNASIFEGFGNEVPLEIIKAHGIPKVVLDTDVSSCINIGGQLEGPFMLSKSGSTRAKAIGRLTGIHIIDRSIRDCITDIRRENQTCDRVRSEIEDIDERLKDYNDIIQLGEKLDKAQESITRMEALLKKVDTLLDKKQRLGVIESEYSKTAKILAKLDKLNECDIYIKSAELSLHKMENIEGIKKKYSDVTKRAGEIEKVMEQTTKVSEGKEILGVIFEHSAKFDRLKKIQTELIKINRELGRAKGILEKTKDIENLELIIKRIRDSVLIESKLAPTAKRLLSIEREIKRLKAVISSYENVRESQSLILLAGEKLENLKRLETLNKDYKEKIDSIREGMRFLEEKKTEINRLLKDYTTVLRQKKVCPLCGSDIKEEKLENIIRHYEEVH